MTTLLAIAWCIIVTAFLGAAWLGALITFGISAYGGVLPQLLGALWWFIGSAAALGAADDMAQRIAASWPEVAP